MKISISISLLVILSLMLSGCKIESVAVENDTDAGSGLPIISSQPVNQSVNAGENASFNSAVQSSSTPVYQWQKDSVNIDGANSLALLITNAQVSDVGMYRLVVSNASGDVVSDSASLTLIDGPPVILIQPANVSTIENSNVIFDVQAESISPINYQWQKDGVDLVAQNSKTLSMDLVTQVNEGNYSVLLTNDVGSTESNVAVLTVALAPAPQISSQPKSISTTAGSDVNFSVVATGTGTLTYQWQKEGNNLSGQTGATLSLNSITAADEGAYQVVIVDDNTTTNSLVATLRILDPATLLIENYQSTGAPTQLLDSEGSPVGNNLSGITWHEGISQYLVVRNNYRRIYRYDVSFSYMGEVDVGGDMHSDSEGIAYVSGNEVLVSTEQIDYVHKVVVDFDTTHINSTYDSENGSPAYKLTGDSTSNNGLEGVAFSPETLINPARVYAVKEKNPMRVYRFDLPEDPNPMELFSYNTNLVVEEPFIAEEQFSSIVTDLAGMVFDKITGHLFILSQESHKVLQVDPDTGAIISTLNLSGAPQYEGITIGSDGEIVVVSEPHWVQVYQVP